VGCAYVSNASLTHLLSLLDWCKKETYAPNGISHWVYTPFLIGRWVLHQNILIQGLLFRSAVAVFSLLSILEGLYTYPVFFAFGVALVLKLRRCQCMKEKLFNKVE
jgi:hypothetical protein